MKTLAIIPARSGSKGLKDKNIIDLCGRPLIDYTIRAALDSGCFDTVMVSTDSEKYAEISRNCGADVPFLRSEKMSSDTAGSWDVVREVLQKYSEMGKNYDYVALLQPTSPLRNKDDIVSAFDILKRDNVNGVVSVTEVAHPVQWCFTLDETDSLASFANSPYADMRRQELAKNYHENGAIYIVDAKKIMDTDYNLHKDNCIAYRMSRTCSIDIDEEIDLIIAKVMMEKLARK